jgi:hypothetical protein
VVSEREVTVRLRMSDGGKPIDVFETGYEEMISHWREALSAGVFIEVSRPTKLRMAVNPEQICCIEEA